MESSAATNTFLVYFYVMMVKELGVDACMIVADGNGEGGIAIDDTIDIGTMVEEVVEDWQDTILTGIVESLVDTHFVSETIEY